MERAWFRRHTASGDAPKVVLLMRGRERLGQRRDRRFRRHHVGLSVWACCPSIVSTATPAPPAAKRSGRALTGSPSAARLGHRRQRQSSATHSERPCGGDIGSRSGTSSTCRRYCSRLGSATVVSASFVFGARSDFTSAANDECAEESCECNAEYTQPGALRSTSASPRRKHGRLDTSPRIRSHAADREL